MRWFRWVLDLFQPKCANCHKPERENGLILFRRIIAGTGQQETIRVCPTCYRSLEKYYATPARKS